MASHQQQKDLVREQFTRTAQVFGDYAVASRVGEAERLARMVRAGPADRAVDLACGPGTLALRLARHVRWICGLDLTPAILERARRTAAAEGLANLEFAIGDAQSLPFPDASVDIAVTSYSVHHFPDPACTIGEMARVVRPGGRVGILDIVLPDDPAISALNTRIEKLRDASHTRTLSREEFESHFAAQGLRTLETGVEENSRSFDHWMLVAGVKPGDLNHVEARRLMEASIPNDTAWFHPRYEPGDSGKPELVFTNTTFFITGEKL
ncbi:MAG: methyltransferase domain-containing protein [Candidatus Acidiferrales bacterium]